MCLFDVSSLIEAHKLLWDCSGDMLKQLTYHLRFSTDKHDAFEATLADILSAFNKLDEIDKLPSFYCEALHLINLPCLEPDPISKRLDTNHEALSCLVQKVDNLSAPLDSTQNANELCLIFEFQSCFITSSLQFGSKPGFSSDLCTVLLM